MSKDYVDQESFDDHTEQQMSEAQSSEEEGDRAHTEDDLNEGYFEGGEDDILYDQHIKLPIGSDDVKVPNTDV